MERQNAAYSYNRTMLELKYEWMSVMLQLLFTYNRTMLELK